MIPRHLNGKPIYGTLPDLTWHDLSQSHVSRSAQADRVLLAQESQVLNHDPSDILLRDPHNCLTLESFTISQDENSLGRK